MKETLRRTRLDTWEQIEQAVVDPERSVFACRDHACFEVVGTQTGSFARSAYATDTADTVLIKTADRERLLIHFGRVSPDYIDRLAPWNERDYKTRESFPVPAFWFDHLEEHDDDLGEALSLLREIMPTVRAVLREGPYTMELHLAAEDVVKLLRRYEVGVDDPDSANGLSAQPTR